MKILNDVSMKNYTTYKTGGIVRTMYFPENENELRELLKRLKKENIKYFIIGNGSNIIVDDNYFDGAIINLKKLNKYSIKNNEVYCECGVMLPLIANMTIKSSLKGLESLISIPGTIGGSIYNNAGAYNVEISNYLKEIRVLNENGEIVTLEKQDCDFKYRDSIFKHTKKYVIISCVFKLEKGNKEELLKIVDTRCEKRKLSQPLEYPSAGSVFRNPLNNYAGALIESLNLKGKTIGGAKVSCKHANFIINENNATSNDIKNLIKLIHEQVLNNYDIDLILEQEIIAWE